MENYYKMSNISEEIQKEIEILNNLIFEVDITNLNKIKANQLAYKIESFFKRFSESFKHGKEFYVKNLHAEIKITDGVDNLNKYAKSKLKYKDNEFFFKGINDIKMGISFIIDDLEKKLENEG